MMQSAVLSVWFFLIPAPAVCHCQSGGVQIFAQGSR